MDRCTGQVALLFAVLCALVTAVSAYAVGATLKSLLIRVVTAAVIGGVLAMITGLWLRINFLQQVDNVKQDMTLGHTVDIAISDDTAEELSWQPLDAEQISPEDTRIIPARK